MRFPYREYISQFLGSNDFRLILRPVITVEISGPSSSARWDALVDSGADETLLPMSLARLLNVELDRDATSLAASFSGDQLPIYYGDVIFRLEGDGERIEWKTTVGFVDFASSDDEVVVLGHGGCLDYFTAVFKGEEAELELRANALIPA